jgi:Uma2 family endonuclease
MSMASMEKSVTADEFFEFARGRRAELIRGEVIPLPFLGAEHGYYAAEIGSAIANFVRQKKRGIVCTATGFCIESDPDSVRAADIAYISNEKLQSIGGGMPQKFSPGAPDLAVEVVSPGDTAEEIESKVGDWFDGGTGQVWVVYPRTKTIHVHRTASEVIVLHRTDILTGGEILPGFEYPLCEIFT